MADPTKRSDENGKEPSSSDDANLKARLKSLDAQLDQATAQRSKTTGSPARSTSDSNALGQAFRLSAEFVSGVVAGGIVGWLVDRLFGVSPWGLIICLMLGFCAGMLNLLRAAGLLKGARYDQKQ
ncbi:AtpZ/AtpI family protein [Microvirga terricola]|uniref:ATP synthase protein I n=1 Tax=Microvirga terricola TaxID=2719797 RepID=A0ABX0VA54_9HYPH|nr:AtpZ/AtpI family protein [Microvirga terricola]NIX76718.1 ATP F0F1 synthase subunit I [Microvirga terricola]